MSEVTAWPLQWPDGWKRTPAGARDRARFGSTREVKSSFSDSTWRQKGQITIAEAVSRIRGELQRMGMVHDRKTGRHLVGMDSAGETPEALLAVLRELETDRDAWRYTAKAFKVAHEYENELLQALRGLHATMAAHTDTPEEVLALDTAETLIAKAADIEPNNQGNRSEPA